MMDTQVWSGPAGSTDPAADPTYRDISHRAGTVQPG
jgi:hypothetical protein